MSDTTNEYNALRSEILTWIQMEFTLIGLTAASITAALGFFKDENVASWPLFSSALLLVLSSLGCLTSFARAKIQLTSAYIVVFHPANAEYEKRIKAVEHQATPFKNKYLFSLIHRVALSALYVVLAVASVYYPFSIQKQPGTPMGFQAGTLLVLSIGAVMFMIFTAWVSHYRDDYVQAWENVQKAEEDRVLIERSPG